MWFLNGSLRYPMFQFMCSQRDAYGVCLCFHIVFYHNKMIPKKFKWFWKAVFGDSVCQFVEISCTLTRIRCEMTKKKKKEKSTWLCRFSVMVKDQRWAAWWTSFIKNISGLTIIHWFAWNIFTKLTQIGYILLKQWDPNLGARSLGSCCRWSTAN